MTEASQRGLSTQPPLDRRRRWRRGLLNRLPVTRARRHLLLPVFDMAAVVVALTAATYLRFELAMTHQQARDLLAILPAGIIIQLLVCTSVGLYAGRWSAGSLEEAGALARAVAIATAALTVLNATVLGHRIPVGACIAAGPIELVAMGAARYAVRLRRERKMRPDTERASRVVVFGAGEGGDQTITAMMRNPDSPWYPIALLDDDPALQHLTIKGIAVSGGREQLGAVAARANAEAVVIAIPSAGATLIRELSTIAEAARLRVMVLPPVGELFGGSVGVDDIRPLSAADLLGRHEVVTDLDAIAGYLTGRRVLVTGAGGSIGSELCRQVSRFAPATLVMLERDESALHAVQLSIEGRAMLDSRNLVICDIRDRTALEAVFREHRPEVIFHAAALKHLPLLQMHPLEAVKTNVLGTRNVLDAARRYRAERFVNISTDKAADPCSVLGYSKRIGERLTAATAQQARGTYLSVRFGNVLGSRGSVLTAFAAQIDGGGPVTVTHADVTRYFMTVEESVQLVIQAGAVGRDGEALVLDMGEPVSVNDVAKRLIEQSDRDIDIVYTGLRPGEKLHEVLLGSDEADDRPAHHLISHVTVAPLGRGAINEFHFDRPAAEVILQLEQVATGGAHDRPPEVVPDSAPAKAPAVTSPTEVVSRAVVSRRTG